MQKIGYVSCLHGMFQNESCAQMYTMHALISMSLHYCDNAVSVYINVGKQCEID